MLSGPSAFEGLEDLTAVRTWFMVRDMGVVSRLCSCLIVLRFLLSEVKLVGLVKCLLNELAISLLVVLMLLLKVMDRFGSVVVGSLLFRDFIVRQYVFWLCLWSHEVFMWSFQICCLCSARL